MTLERRVVDCSGAPAVVEIAGEGPDVVFIGAAAPLAAARGAAHALAEMEYRVVSFDYGPPADWEGEPEPRTVLAQADDVMAVIEAIGMEKAHLVGISRGAMTAYGIAARRPDLAASLTLAFPVAGFADTLTKFGPTHDPVEDLPEDEMMQATLRTVFSEEFLELNEQWATRIATAPPGSVIRVETRSEEDAFDDTMSVDLPTLVVEGGSDQIVSPEHPARYLADIPNAVHELVPDAEHLWFAEAPDLFAEILDDFYSTV